MKQEDIRSLTVQELFALAAQVNDELLRRHPHGGSIVDAFKLDAAEVAARQPKGGGRIQ